MSARLSFDLPPGLEASSPPEARGLTRDAVRMMVAYKGEQRIQHSTFALLPAFLEPDDLLVINTSGTMAAAITGFDPEGGHCVPVHLSSHLGGEEWVVEPRLPAGHTTERWPPGPPPPAHLRLGEDGSTLSLIEPYLGSRRLWRARRSLPGPALPWVGGAGRPVSHAHAQAPRPPTASRHLSPR